MADEPTTPEEDPKDEPTGDGPGDLGDAGKKALDAERKARRDAEARLKQLEAKLEDIEDADKSELQKAQDKAAKAEADAAKATARADRLQVALDKGLTATQAKRLVGDSIEELEADADELLADFTPSDDGKKKTVSDPTPKTNLQSGNDVDDDDDDAVDAEALADKIMDRGI